MQNPNISRLLLQAKNVQQSDSENWTCYCPVHEGDGDGHANSLSVSAGNDGKILVNCHAGCDAKQIVYAFGLTWSDCFPPKNDTPGSRITATYDYHDADGILRFQVCRIEPGKDGRAKDFRQRQPDGMGGWSWKTKGIAKFPYRLRELASVDKTQPVYIVEGEKQVDYMRSLGLAATTNPGGAGKWLKSYAKYFADRDCIVIPDADLPNEKTGKIVGAEHAQQVADSLIGIATKIRVVELPNCKPKWGLDDWLQKGGNTLDELYRIVSRAAQWGPDSTLTMRVEKPAESEPKDPLQRYRDILADCGIIYAAQHDRGDVEIFSEVTQKFTTWGASRLGGLKHEDLMLACGHIIDLKVKISAEDDTANWTVKQVRSAIAIVASATPAVEDKRGIGVWEDKGCIVVATSRRLAILNGTPAMQISSHPVQLGTAYDIGDRCDWVDIEQVRDDILAVDAQPGKLHIEDVHALEDIFSKWSYTVPDSAFPPILAGLVLATFVQTMWTWRPQVFLTGQPYCGKTAMFQVLRRVMGPLCASSSSSSAAGIRQYIGSSGRIAMTDELEKSQHRKDITEMIRMAGRGDDSFRGSQGNTGHIKHHLQHIFWAAATESGLSKEADTSRFIVVDIRKVDERFEIPTHDTLHAMGQRLIGTAICNVREARRVGEYLLANKPPGAHGRVCESYSVPVGMYAAATGLSDAGALGLFVAALDTISEANSIESDADRILSEILSANVQVVGGRHSIAQMIDGLKYEELEAYGIYIEFGTDLAHIHCPAVVRHLVPDLKGTLIEDILCRLPGAKKLGRGQRVKGRQYRRMVEIPMTTLRPVAAVANSSEHINSDLFQ